jgi:hypothetical protein
LSRTTSADDGEEVPGGGDAFEVVFAPVVEAEAGSGNQIDDRARDEDLARLCGSADAMGECRLFKAALANAKQPGIASS